MDHSPRPRRKRFNEYWKRRETARRAGEPIFSVFDEFPELFGSNTKTNTKTNGNNNPDDWAEFEREMQAFEDEMNAWNEEMFASFEQSKGQGNVWTNTDF